MNQSYGKISFLLDSGDSKIVRVILNDIEGYTKKNIPPAYSAELSGDVKTVNSVDKLVVTQMLMSIASSIVTIFVIILLMFKSFRISLLTTFPPILTLIGNFAIMAFFHIDLNTGTSMIAALILGVGVDYSIHFVSQYLKFRTKYGRYDSVIHTLNKVSLSVVLNGVAVGAGVILY